MPRLHENINICGTAQADCISEVKNEMRKKENQSFVCDCLLGCWTINYKTELSITHLFERSPLLQELDLNKSSLAVLHAYFKDGHFRSSKKEEYIGFTEFLCKHFCMICVVFVVIFNLLITKFLFYS